VPTPVDIREVPEWDEEQRLAAEKQTLGLYLTGHPVSRYEAELVRITGKRIADLIAERLDDSQGVPITRQAQTVLVAGLVVAIRTRPTQTGRVAFVTLDDRSARIEAGVFSDEYNRHVHLLNKDKILVVEGRLGLDDYTGNLRLRAKRLMDIDQARAHYAKRLQIKIATTHTINGFIGELKEVIAPYREGTCPVQVAYTNNHARVLLALDDSWQVVPREELLERLRALKSVRDVDVMYA